MPKHPKKDHKDKPPVAADPQVKEEAACAEAADEDTPQDTEKTAPAAAGLEAKLAAAEQRADAAQAKADETHEQLLRTAAEYDNFRKRSQKEQEATFAGATCCTVLELLPILDTLQAAAEAPTTDEEYKKGVLLILTKAQEVFDKMGIAEIPAMGAPFDPELHNAVMQEAAENAQSGEITRVIQKGYKLGERVIRYAMVAVAP